MRAGSRIVNAGSVSGVLTTPFAGAYRATKSALRSRSDVLRLKLNPFGIHVILVQPGAIRSSFGDHASEAVDRVLKADSRYAFCKGAIYGRARASQCSATPTAHVARYCYRAVAAVCPRAVVQSGRAVACCPCWHDCRWHGAIDCCADSLA